MKALNSIGLGLSVLFTCLLLALVGEIYYLLWWKRRRIIVNRNDIDIENDNHTTDCSKKSSSSYNSLCCQNNQAAPSVVNISTNITQQHHSPILPQEVHSCPEYKAPEGQNGHFSSGPAPGSLFTIKEETTEEIIMESASLEEGKCSLITGETERSRKSLNDLLKCVDNVTPYVTPSSSPPFLTPSTPNEHLSGCSDEVGLNNGAYNKLWSSPPPKFKFLRNAEEKLVRKTMLMKRESDLSSNEGVNGSFINIIVAENNKENDDKLNHHYHSPLCHSTSCSSSSSTTRKI
ncbi:hypothetical protein vseg_005893 [Gypsophila vaccaria]